MSDWNEAIKNNNEWIEKEPIRNAIIGWEGQLKIFKHVLAHIEQGYTMADIKWNCEENIKVFQSAIDKEKERL